MSRSKHLRLQRESNQNLRLFQSELTNSLQRREQWESQDRPALCMKEYDSFIHIIQTDSAHYHLQSAVLSAALSANLK